VTLPATERGGPAELCGHSLVIICVVLIARLREALEHPDWQWEVERQRAIRNRVEATRLRKTLDQICVAELPATMERLPGMVTIHCRNMEYLLEQRVQLARALDNDSETLQRLIEPPPARRPVGSEMA